MLSIPEVVSTYLNTPQQFKNYRFSSLKHYATTSVLRKWGISFVKVIKMMSLRTFTMSTLIFMVVFASFVLSFRPFHQEGFPDVETQQEKKEGTVELSATMGMEEDYARQIPTGPDPLHHNSHHPSWP